MPLTITKKKELVAEIVAKLETSELCLFMDTIGLTVTEATDLRTKLHEKSVDFKIYKNTLIKRAIEEKGDEGLKPLLDHLQGPTGVAVTTEDPIEATKVFVDFMKENEKLSVKAAVFQGDYWDEGKTKEMAKLGSMSAIYGQLVMALKTPMSKLTNVLGSQARDLVLTLKAIAEKGE